MTTAYKKSWPVNLLQVSNLTFDPCFTVERGYHNKTAIYILYIGPWAWNSFHERIKYVSFPLSSITWKFLYPTTSCGFCISVYFLQLKLFLKFSEISMSLPI